MLGYVTIHILLNSSTRAQRLHKDGKLNWGAMKTEAGLLSLHLNSDYNPSAKATSSCLLSVLLFLVKKRKKKNHKSTQQNKHVAACTKPHPISFMELKLAQNFFPFRNLSHALLLQNQKFWLRFLNPPPCPAKGALQPWKFIFNTSAAPTSECHQDTWISQQVSKRK